MQFIKGNKREIVINEWKETLRKRIKNVNDSMGCFERFNGTDDLRRLIEDCEKLMKDAENARESIHRMNVLSNKEETDTLKNLNRLSDLSSKGKTPLYYSPEKKAVYDTPGEGRFYLTDLVRKNTPEEIQDTVKYMMAL